ERRHGSVARGDVDDHDHGRERRPRERRARRADDGGGYAAHPHHAEGDGPRHSRRGHPAHALRDDRHHPIAEPRGRADGGPPRNPSDSAGPANESGQTRSVTAVSPASTQGGTVALLGGNITYTPAGNFNGTDTFTYTVADDCTTNGLLDAKSTTGTVTVTVSAV